MFAPCHGHYHFSAFADYRLMNSAGVPAAIGRKVGFCLEDVSRWSPTARTRSRYDCDNQGIQAGWADVYNERLSCQWIDITDTPAGLYQVELEVNPERRMPETNYSNNLARIAVVLDAACAGPPANDNFNNPVLLSKRVETLLGSVSCATRAAGEPNHAATSGSNSIWFRWSAPYTGAAVVTTAGSSVDTLLAVYRGTNVANLTIVTSNDDDGELYTSRVSFNATSNTVYQIAVAGYQTRQGGVALNINPAGNDALTNCLALRGASGCISGLSTSARREPGEPLHSGVFGSNSVWFCWHSPTNGVVQFDTEGSGFDTLLAIYTGVEMTGLVSVAADNDSGTNKTSRVSFAAVPGIDYLIAVDGVNGMSGLFNLNWRGWGPAPILAASADLTGMTVELRVAGAVGQHYRVERSADLLAWTPWIEATNLAGVIQLSDRREEGQRFYRVVLPP
jgi:hypothetical protein